MLLALRNIDHATPIMRTPPIESAVVAELRRGSCHCRVQLSRQLSVSPSTIGIHVDRLLANGYLREAAKEETQSGRPPKRLELNPEAGQFIGVDLDAREIHSVSVDFSQRLLRDQTESIRASDGIDEVLQRLKQVIRSVHDPSRMLLGIGLAMPGTIDPDNGLGLHYQFIRGWNDVPLIDQIRDEFDVPVALENNVRTMALAERWFGQARRVDNAICVGIRSGIGSGVIINGELHRGKSGFAGEIGGWPIVSGGDATTLEEVASLRAVLNRLTESVRSGETTSLELSRQQVTRESLVAAADANDSLVIHVLRTAAIEVARAISQMALLVDPERVIVCGPLASLQNAFVEPLRDAASRFLPSTQPSPEIVASELGDFVGALGAAALTAQQWQPNFCRPERVLA